MKKALILDSDKMNRNIISKLLKNNFSFEVTTEEIIPEIGPVLEKAEPELIFLGMGAQVKTGIEILEKIRNDEKYKELPVVIMSSISERGTLTKLLELGITDLIVKPFERNATHAKLRQIINKLKGESGTVSYDGYAKKKPITKPEFIDLIQNHLRGTVNNAVYDIMSKKLKEGIKVVKLKQNTELAKDITIKIKLKENKSGLPLHVALLSSEKGMHRILLKLFGGMIMDWSEEVMKPVTDMVNNISKEICRTLKKQNLEFKFEETEIERESGKINEMNWHQIVYFMNETGDIYALALLVKDK